MGASKSKHLLSDATSVTPLITMSMWVIGAVVLLAESQAFAQPALGQAANGRRPAVELSGGIQPHVVDFSEKNRQKAETKKQQQDARGAAAQAHAQKASGLTQQAAQLPEDSEFFEEASPPSRLRKYNERSNNAEARQFGRQIEEIPTLSELAEPAQQNEAPAETSRETFKRPSRTQKSIRQAADVRGESLTSPQPRRSVNELSQPSDVGHEESKFLEADEQRTEVEQVNAGRRHKFVVLYATPDVPSMDDLERRERTKSTSSGPTTTNNSEQSVVSYSTIILSVLFGAVLVIVGVLFVLLKKFGPNSTIVFKVEMVNSGRDAAPAERSTESHPESHAPPSLRIAPIYAMKMQEEAEREQQQEEAMMRKVFEDNLELREQLGAKRNAA